MAELRMDAIDETAAAEAQTIESSSAEVPAEAVR
jgi:hypothetical protein